MPKTDATIVVVQDRTGDCWVVVNDNLFQINDDHTVKQVTAIVGYIDSGDAARQVKSQLFPLVFKPVEDQMAGHNVIGVYAVRITDESKISPHMIPNRKTIGRCTLNEVSHKLLTKRNSVKIIPAQ